MSRAPAPRLSQAGAVFLAAAALLPACRGPVPDVENAFAPGARIRFRTEGRAEAWREGLVGTVGPCRVIFVPSPPPPEPAQRYFPVYPDSVTELRVGRAPAPDGAGRASARASEGADSAWVAVAAAEVRRRFGGCRPF